MTINKYRRENGFTLLELLIVIGILAIVGVIVMLILNPAELFSQSRDTRRMVDLKNIDSAVRLARTESIFMGNPNIVYISVPDPALSGNATSSCPNMGLPPLDPSWKYNCVSQDNLAKNNGTGWIPINFSSLGVGSPFASLPMDPENTTSSWRYYRYITDSKGKYIAVSGLYSDKFKPEAAKDGGNDSEKYEVGTNMSLWEESKKYNGLVRKNCTGYVNCFTSLYQWQQNYAGIPFGSCAQGDLNCVDKIAVAKIDGAWTSADTMWVSINGWTTTSNNYIRIYTTPAARHNGKWNDSKYRLSVTNNYGINNYEAYVRFEGLQLDLTVTAAIDVGLLNMKADNTAETGEVRVSYSILRSHPNTYTSTQFYGIDNWYGTNYVFKVRNNIVYDFMTTAVASWAAGIRSNESYGATYYYNNTVYGSKIGIADGDYAKNNISYNNTDNYYGAYNAASTNNLSGPTQADAPGSSPKNAATVNFVDETNRDFHLATTDTSAKDAGVNLSADPSLSFNDDIDGQTRGPIWDIGADEL